jgi:hypothetical protein
MLNDIIEYMENAIQRRVASVEQVIKSENLEAWEVTCPDMTAVISNAGVRFKCGHNWVFISWEKFTTGQKTRLVEVMQTEPPTVEETTVLRNIAKHLHKSKLNIANASNEQTAYHEYCQRLFDRATNDGEKFPPYV